MAAYDNKVLTGDQLTYLVSLIKGADNNKQDVIDITHKLSAGLVNTDTTHNFVTDSEKTTWNGKTTLTEVQGLGYQTSSQVQSAIATAISGISTFRFEVVNSLPTTDISTSTIYLVAKSSAGTNNVYTEYAYVNNNWEILGDTQVSIDALTNAEVQTIWESAT